MRPSVYAVWLIYACTASSDPSLSAPVGDNGNAALNSRRAHVYCAEKKYYHCTKQRCPREVITIINDEG